MRPHAARGVVVLFALVLAGVGVPCACAEMNGAVDSSAGHCGSAASGLRATVEACSCCCIAARDKESAPPEDATVMARSIAAAPQSQALVPGACPQVPSVRLRFAGHSPPRSAPSILRI
jgi:hypothetical protein